MTSMMRVGTSFRMSLFAVMVMMMAFMMAMVMTAMFFVTALVTLFGTWAPAFTVATITSTITIAITSTSTSTFILTLTLTLTPIVIIFTFFLTAIAIISTFTLTFILILTLTSTSTVTSAAGTITPVLVMVVVVVVMMMMTTHARFAEIDAVHCPMAWLATPETDPFAVLPLDSRAIGYFHYDHIAHYGLATHLLDGPLGVIWVTVIYEREPGLHDHLFYGAASIKLLSKNILRDSQGKIPHVNSL